MELWDIVRDVFVGITSAGGAWFFARRKNNAEASRAELENVEKAITIWREQAEKLMTQVAALEAKISQLEKDNENLHDEIRRLRGRVTDTK